MYKAIKDKKIIALNESCDFPCLVFDNIIEDNEHVIDDYAQYNCEFLLKTDIPTPLHEEQRKKRAIAYRTIVDPITSQIQRLRDLEQTDEVICEIQNLILERSIQVEKIKEQFPY